MMWMMWWMTWRMTWQYLSDPGQRAAAAAGSTSSPSSSREGPGMHRHVIGCRPTQDTRVHHALDDVPVLLATSQDAV